MITNLRNVIISNIFLLFLVFGSSKAEDISKNISIQPKTLLWPDILPEFWFSCLLFPPDSTIITDDEVIFYLYTKSNKDLPVPMRVGEELSTFFDLNAPVKIIIHGYNSGHGAGILLKDAYLSLITNTNVILVDWSNILHFDYCQSAQNTKVAGQRVAEFINHLVSQNVQFAKIHLIGHSLGSHVSAFAAKEFTSPKIKRLTALDPAYPSFQNVPDTDRLAPTDAEFVDVIHTNGQRNMESSNDARLGLGFTEPRGHADFYPNGGHFQPGCPYYIIPYVCSHGRAWDLMAESITNPKGFPSRKCAGWKEYTRGRCAMNETAYMGEHVQLASRGIYFLDTHDKTPFAKGTTEDDCFGNSCPTKPKPVKVKCTLEWVGSNMGEDLPKTSVPTSTGNENHYFARSLMGELGNEKYIAGRWEDGEVYTVLNGEIIVNATYEILTNPYGCILSFEKQLSKFDIPTAPGYFTYVGRATINGELLGGEISGGKIQIAGNDEKIYNLENNFEILQAHRFGLDLDITDFKFDTDIFAGAKDFLGMEEIINNAETTVSQTLTHSKKIMESNTLETSTTWKHVGKICYRAEPEIKYKPPGTPPGTPGSTVSGPKLEMCYTLTRNTGEHKSLTTRKEYEISVTREVIVPPLTSVKLCSSVTVVEYAKVGFSAIGRYSAPGLTAEEVAELLKEDGKFGVADGDGVLVAESGTFGGKMAFSPQFVVVPFDDISACSNLNE